MKLLAAAAAGAAMLAAAAPAAAQRTAASPAAEPKISTMIIYGDDPCPPSTDDTIVVCARKPDAERYRIPEVLRGDPNDPKNQAWASRATALEYAGRSGIGSCSPVGSGGASGCFNQIVREARAERSADPSVNWNALIEQARRERLGRIDEAAEAEEADAKADEAANPR
ncbi:MAG: hypothetical protein QOJ27_1655 [Sphingomonadales bacterium]|jgi:hypothetical protein|nr:hypothetical protein [Sphingomonadales bacterium]